MKNRVLFLLALQTAVVLQGQTVHTPQLDTIEGREITYFYIPEWVTACSVYYNTERGVINNITYGIPYYTDSTLRICGIAFCAGRDPDPNSINYGGGNQVTGSEWELSIQEAGTGHMIPLAGQIANTDSISRWMKVRGHEYRGSMYYPMIDPEESEIIVPVTEVYFNSTVTVNDSFYVAYRALWGNYDEFLVSRWWSWMWGYFYDGAECDAPRYCVFNPPDQSFHYGEFVAGGNKRLWKFPIIDSTGWYLKCDTMVCDAVKGLTLNFQREYHMVTCSWLDDTLLHSEWEMSYGPVGTPPGGGRVVHTMMPNWVVTGLEDTVDYVFYVRGFCAECKKWGDWSEGAVVSFGNGNPEGIQQPEEVDRLTFVAPNPTRGKATVHSDLGVLRVAVHNVHGTAVRTWHALYGGKTPLKECELDVSGLPAGLYVVTIVTPFGTTKTRLVVEN